MNKPGNTELTEHFDRLLDLHLERKASREQQDELRALAEQFGDRFGAKFDSVINSELIGEDMGEQIRQEILTNILSREPVRETTPKTVIWKWAAAAAITIAAATVVFIGLRENPADKIEFSRQQGQQEQKYYAGRQFVKLTDGSTVLMSDNARLHVTEDFNQQVRMVKLEGKAYFDIAHNPSKPFKVVTGEVITTVLGTAFSIDATPQADGSLNGVEVTVTRGKVQVGDQTQVYGLLTRNQQLKINLETKQFEKTSTDADKVTAWKREYLIFDNVTMEVAAAILKEKYNVNILYSTEAIRHCDFTATFIDGESLEQVLEVISTLAKVKYEILPDGNVRLKGEGCKPAP